MKTIIIDFGTHEFKYLLCNIDGQRIQLLDFAVSAAAPEHFRGLAMPEPSAWATATIRLNELDWLKPEEDTLVITALPSSYLEARYLRFPFKADKKIEKVLQFELEATIPFDIEEIQIRHKVLEGEGVGSSTKKDALVLSMSYRRDLIKAYETELRKFQLSIPAITSEILALSTLRQFVNTEAAVYGLLSVGHSKTQFLLMQKAGHILGLRTFWWGGKNVDEFAEKSDPESCYRELATEIRQTLKSWGSSGLKVPKPGLFFVTGAAARSPAFLSTVEAALRSEFDVRLRTLPLDMLIKARVVGGLERLTPEALEKALPGLSVALAQTRVHRQRVPIFSETSFQLQRNLRKLRTGSFHLLRKVAVLLIVPVIYTFLHFYIQSKENAVVLTKLNESLRSSGFQAKKDESSDSIVKRMRTEISQNRVHIDQLAEDNGSPLQVLTEVSAAIPASLRLDVRDFKVTISSVLMTATTANEEIARDVIARLKTKFPGVKPGAITDCKEKKDCKSFTVEWPREQAT